MALLGFAVVCQNGVFCSTVGVQRRFYLTFAHTELQINMKLSVCEASDEKNRNDASASAQFQIT